MTAPLALKAAVFDWAGTVVDFGSRAPMGAFVEVFRRFGVEIGIEDARGPMGLPKRDHIAALFRLPHVVAKWRAAKGADPGEAAIDAVYDMFVPLNAEIVTDFADMIPGAVETVRALRARGLKIGSTTGYTREIMARLTPIAATAGYTPDTMVCAGDLAEGRPSPLMMYRVFADLGVYPPAAVVKIDDTVPGILEAKAAGTWAVGVAVTGNEFGLSHADTEALRRGDPLAYEARRAVAARTLREAGAHYVIDGVADLLPVIDDIEGRLRARERP